MYILGDEITVAIVALKHKERDGVFVRNRSKPFGLMTDLVFAKDTCRATTSYGPS